MSLRVHYAPASASLCAPNYPEAKKRIWLSVNDSTHAISNAVSKSESTIASVSLRSV